MQKSIRAKDSRRKKMINAIFFDWGGVLKKGRQRDAIQRVLISRTKKEIDKHDIGKELDLMDTSEKDLAGFTDSINKRYGLNLTEKEMYDVFYESVDENDTVTDIAKQLKDRYRIFILSNNNPTTLKVLKKKCKDMLSIFEKTYFSSEMGHAKPGKKIFELALKDSGASPEESLFIDDKEKNTKVAEDMGFKTIVFKDNKQLKKDMKKILLFQ